MDHCYLPDTENAEIEMKLRITGDEMKKKFIFHRSCHYCQMLPRSRCVKSCQPGSAKIVQQGKEFCCYDCSQCPVGKISTQIGK